MNKSSLRSEFRQRRRSLSDKEQTLAASRLAEIFVQEGLHLNHQRIGVYSAADGEIDPGPIADFLLEAEKQCFLPVLNPSGENSLYFGEFSADTAMIKNRFGIDEPATTKKLSAMELDLILLPLVSFDRSGNRVGMGKGFYDRTLAPASCDETLCDETLYQETLYQETLPTLIGLAHACQETESIETNPWDVPLNYILTDKELISVER